ncbi:MAG: gamma-glutamyltransferase [Pseudomonadales bacterium]
MRICVRASISGLVLAGLLLCTVVTQAASREAVHAAGGMVASRSAIASKVGADILRQGGNAIDAAVATGFALAVTHPSAGNLGGGGFMVIRLADGTLISNDHRERAPAAATRDMYLDADGEFIADLSTKTHLASGVPGSVDGLLAVHERYGRLSLKQVINPAIRLAEKGFPLSYDLSSRLAARLSAFEPFAASIAAFSNKGKPYAEGERLVQKDLAATLKRVRRHGRDGFYSGRTADLLVAEMQRGGGLINHQDLQDYRSVWREPVRGTYRGYEIVGMPPPSSGGALVVQMLNMLEPYDIGALGYGSAATMHLMIEAERRAFADRAEHLGDPDFYDVPLKMLTSKAYAQQRFADFDPEKASLSSDIGAGQWPTESPDTTHASFMDHEGNSVAYTTTLNLSYGSKIVVTGAGFLLNNEMDDFSAKPDTPNAFGLLGREANSIEPGKRMLSSMTPTIVLKDGAPVLVTGSPGGSTIITTTLQVIMNVIDHGMDLSDAVGKPRFHHQWQPNRIVYERFGVSPDTLQRLQDMGHQGLVLLPWGRGLGDANSVSREADKLHGMSDPRNDGGAAGVVTVPVR